MSHRDMYDTRHVTPRCTRHQPCHTTMYTTLEMSHIQCTRHQACHTAMYTTPGMSRRDVHDTRMSHHNGHNTRHVTPQCTRHQACHASMHTPPGMSHHNGHKPGMSHHNGHKPGMSHLKSALHQTCHTKMDTTPDMFNTMMYTTPCMSHHSVHDTSAHDTMHVTPQCTRH